MDPRFTKKALVAVRKEKKWETLLEKTARKSRCFFPAVIFRVKPFSRELHVPEGMLTQACADASAICSLVIPALQMFVMERMCFMTYWDKDPQLVSNVLT